MIKVRGFRLVILSLLVATISTTTFAGFEPLFRVIKVTGECSLKRPKERKFAPAEESKAYPYGTKIRTGVRSSLVVIFSEGNICRVLPNTDLTMSERASNKKLKTVRLKEGEVEVELKEDFKSDGNALSVETATAICDAIGCKFNVTSKTEDELCIVLIRCIEGMIRVHGDNFDAAELDEGDWLSLLTPPDLSFLRLKTEQGEFDITIKDEKHADKNVATETGTVLKIWQQEVPGTGQIVVVAELTGPDGKLISSVTVTYDAGTRPTLTGPQGGETPPERGNPVVSPIFDPSDPDPDPADDDHSQDGDETPPATELNPPDPSPKGRR